MSMNGWETLKASDKRLRDFPYITGKVRAGDVWTIFDDLCEQFQAKVEKITRAHSWGYRAATGGYPAKWNHTSGTAIDLNAPRHPQGKRGTFTTAQAAAIRGIVRQYGGAIRWGGDYQGTPDEMHFEINADAATVARVAATIKGGPTPPKPAKPATTYTVKRGDSLSAIAARHGTTWQALYAANRAVIGSNPSLIRPGQVLRIP